MSETIQIPNVSDFMKKHLKEVFETMLSMPTELSLAPQLPHHDSRVTGSIGFAGENINGAVYLHLSAGFAVRVAAAMLGLPPEELTNDHEVNDVVGEVTNMLAGGLKSWFCDNGNHCAMSTPAIIRGASYEVESMPDVVREQMIFASGDELLMIEIHLKLG